MKNVKVVLGLVKNLFSLSTVMRNNCDLLTETPDNTKVLKIKKNDVEYKFDRKVSKNANRGYLMGMEIVPDKIDEDENENEKENKNNNKNKNIEKQEKGSVSTEIGAKIDINKLHEKLGHMEEEVTKLMVNYMRLKIKGKMENCENCAIEKMRQQNVAKGPKEKSTKQGYRMYIDSMLLIYSQKPQWLINVV